MKKIAMSALAAMTLTSVSAFAAEAGSITIVDKKSPDFMFGKQTHINMKMTADDNPDMWLKAGVRIQTAFENTDTDYVDASKTDTSIQDAYLRRTRFEVQAGFTKNASFTMDVRNDKANFQEKGEQEFNVGDAYVKIKKPFGSSNFNVKLFRAKIDISRTETVKSARVIVFDRPAVADAAAQYISHNRRGTNAQIYGDFDKKFHYQLAVGDAVHESKLKDAKGVALSKVGKITEQTFFYGGKIRLSPFDGWEETKRTETYFGRGKHFSVGASYWVVPEIKATGANDSIKLENKLTNLEVSGHYKGFFAQAEYFKFEDTVQDWSAAALTKTESSGWYATAEYVMPELNYIAPFFRYESWDKDEKVAGSEYTSTLAGVNWYLKGNTIKAGFVYQKDEYGSNIGNKDVEKMRITTQWFF